MRIVVDQAPWQWVSEKDESLVVMASEEIRLRESEGVTDFTAAFIGDQLHVIGLMEETVGHWVGDQTKPESTLALDGQQVSQLNAVGDGNQLHLFYLTKKSRSQGYTWFHRLYDGTWHETTVVGSHVAGSGRCSVACRGPDGYLHSVCVHESEGWLLYRCYEVEAKIWSGSVPIVRRECAAPGLMVTDSVHLTWLEGEPGKEVLRYRQLTDQWQPETVVVGEGECGDGYGFDLVDGRLSIIWANDDTTWERVLDDEWGEAQQREGQEQVLRLFRHDQTSGSMVFPSYVRDEPRSQTTQQPPQPETQPVDQPKWTPGRMKHAQVDDLEKQLESDLLRQAFGAQKRWEEIERAHQTLLEDQSKWKDALKAEIKDEFAELLGERPTQDMEKRLREIGEELREIPALREEIEDLRNRLIYAKESWRSFQANPKVPALDQLEKKVVSIDQALQRVQRPSNDKLLDRMTQVEKRLQTVARSQQELQTSMQEKGVWRRLLRR